MTCVTQVSAFAYTDWGGTRIGSKPTSRFDPSTVKMCHVLAEANCSVTSVLRTDEIAVVLFHYVIILSN